MPNVAGKKPDPDFVIRLVGPGVTPWVVSLRRLASVLEAVQRLVDQREDEAPDDEPTQQPDRSGRSLQLLGVVMSSAAYPVASTDGAAVLQLIEEAGKAIAHPSDSDWFYGTLSSIRELSDVARALGCEIEFRRPGKGRSYGEILAKIKPSTYGEIESAAFITGPTSVYGRIERVGGATEMRCGLRLPDRPNKMLFCTVASAELVRELGQYMYQHVLVSGRATWLRHNWQLKSLDINSYEPPKTGSIREALDRARASGGDAWDAVEDPGRYIMEMRG